MLPNPRRLFWKVHDGKGAGIGELKRPRPFSAKWPCRVEQDLLERQTQFVASLLVLGGVDGLAEWTLGWSSDVARKIAALQSIFSVREWGFFEEGPKQAGRTRIRSENCVWFADFCEICWDRRSEIARSQSRSYWRHPGSCFPAWLWISFSALEAFNKSPLHGSISWYLSVLNSVSEVGKLSDHWKRTKWYGISHHVYRRPTGHLRAPPNCVQIARIRMFWGIIPGCKVWACKKRNFKAILSISGSPEFF